MTEKTEFAMLKVRGWKLEGGEILALIFIRKPDDKLELLSEQYAKDDAEFHRIVDEAKARLETAAKEAGHEGVAYTQVNEAPTESLFNDGTREN